MGHGRWNANDWRSYTASHTQGRSAHEIFGAHAMKPAFDPAQIRMRESRDSAWNPSSTAQA